MTDNDIPMWAVKEAIERCTAKCQTHALYLPTDAHIQVIAALIAKHEQPPVDPDLAEARECAALAQEAKGTGCTGAGYRLGRNDDSISVQAVLIRLQREKEGKRA